MLALTVVVPVPAVAAAPAGLTIATFGSEEVHFAKRVMSCEEPSLMLAVAVNCCELPSAIELLCGATAMDVMLVLVTVMLALPTMPVKSAVTVVDPGAIAVSTPREVLPLLTVATDEVEEVHFTAPVTFWLVPSANVPVAVSCSGVCWAMVPLFGAVIFKLTSGDEVTRRLLDPLTLPRVAVMLVVPGLLPIASPEELTPATEVELEPQVAARVTDCDEPSSNCPVAEYCTPVAGATTKFCGATSSPSNTAPLTFKAAEPVLLGPPGLLKLALILAVPWLIPVARPFEPPTLLPTVAMEA